LTSAPRKDSVVTTADPPRRRRHRWALSPILVSAPAAVTAGSPNKELARCTGPGIPKHRPGGGSPQSAQTNPQPLAWDHGVVPPGHVGSLVRSTAYSIPANKSTAPSGEKLAVSAATRSGVDSGLAAFRGSENPSSSLSSSACRCQSASVSWKDSCSCAVNPSPNSASSVYSGGL